MYVEDTDGSVTAFTDANVAAGGGHVCRVKAVNAAGLSHWPTFVLSSRRVRAG